MCMLLSVCVLVTQSLSIGSVALSGAYFGSGSGAILLDNVVCRGTESSLLECSTNPIGQHNCDHLEDAGVRCEGIHNAIKPRLHFLSTLHISVSFFVYIMYFSFILCLHYVF